MRNLLLIFLFIASFSVKGQLRDKLKDIGVEEADISPIELRIRFEIDYLTENIREIAYVHTKNKRDLINQTVELFSSEKSTIQNSVSYNSDRVRTYKVRDYLIGLSNKAHKRDKHIDIQIAYKKRNEITTVERVEDPTRLGKYYSDAYIINIAKWQVYAVLHEKEKKYSNFDFEELLKLKSENVIYKDLEKKIFSLIVFKDKNDIWQCKFKNIISSKTIPSEKFCMFILTEKSFQIINKEITNIHKQKLIQEKTKGKIFDYEDELQSVLNNIIGINKTNILLPKILKNSFKIK